MTSASDCGGGLDHIGFIVPDLDASADLVDRLGFCQTVRADHTRTNSAGELVSAGSSQRSVMLHRGYIEFMQITDPAAGHQLTPATRVRHGLHVLALGTDDAPAFRQACVAAGVPAGALMNWARLIREGPCQGEARFSYFDAPWDPQDPSYICWVQHLTPALVRPPHLLQHANGAQALVGVYYRGQQPLAQAWIARLVQAGARIASTWPGGVRLVLSGAFIEVSFDLDTPLVRPVAIEIAFTDLGDIADRCRQLGLVLRERADGALDVDLVGPFGLHWILSRTAVRNAPA